MNLGHETSVELVRIYGISRQDSNKISIWILKDKNKNDESEKNPKEISTSKKLIYDDRGFIDFQTNHEMSGLSVSRLF